MRIAYSPSRQPQKKRMIRNPGTCGAYSIRPYPDGRKDLSLRSILWLWEMVWPFFWYGKCSCRTDCFSILINKRLCEMVQPFFDHKKDHAKRYIRYFCRGVLHTPLQDVPKRNVWSESRYIWGVCNTPLPWRTKRPIPKINFLVMQNGMTLFLI